MLKWGGCTDLGRTRPLNEDGYYISEYSTALDALYAIVADGMGGHRAGEVASALAIRIISEKINQSVHPDLSFQDLKAILVKAVKSANEAIYEKGREDGQYSGMGTTLTLCFVIKNKGLVIHVGDSRLYLMRKETLHRVTTDHSLVQALLSKGQITEEEAECHPQKNVITRALGTESRVEIDIYEFDIFDGDLLLLCTDGLSNMLPDPRLAELLNEERGLSLERLAELLVSEANQKGGLDNITAVLLEKEADLYRKD